MNKRIDISNAQEEVRSLIERWAKAVREEDLDGILASHSPDMLMFDIPAPTQSKGIGAYKKTWDVFFPWFKGSGVFDLSELDVTAGDDVAFATGLIHCRGSEKGKPEELSVRLTVGLRKIDGRWTVMHEHHSVPTR
jgi:uncharacterized protein (TIGR02246 family)